MGLFFRKSEKLISEKEIELLFRNGKSSFIYPIKMISTLSANQPSGCRILVTVSKRYLKKAVDRNLVKRRIREAYRLNSLPIKEKLADKKISASIGFIYASSKIIPYDKVDAIVKKHISNFLKQIDRGEQLH